MEYRKEKQFIVAYDENGIYKGKYDILENVFWGVRNQPVKNCPAFNKSNRNNDLIVNSLMNFLKFDYPYSPDCSKMRQRLEQVISVRLTVSPDCETAKFMATDRTRLNPDCVNYINLNYNGEYSRRSIVAYCTYRRYTALFEKYPDNKDWIASVLKSLDSFGSLTTNRDYVGRMIERGIKEKVFIERPGYLYADIIHEWYDISNNLGIMPEIKNILTNHAILKWEYKTWKDEHRNEMLKKNNDKDWLRFEDDEFIAFPLLTAKEFLDEATAQGNCVERIYMDKVVEGSTHVVVIRRKSEIDKSLITCEVNNNHAIKQYLLRFNHSVYSDTPEYAFRCKYQDFLNSSLSE